MFKLSFIYLIQDFFFIFTELEGLRRKALVASNKIFGCMNCGRNSEEEHVDEMELEQL